MDAKEYYHIPTSRLKESPDYYVYEAIDLVNSATDLLERISEAEGFGWLKDYAAQLGNVTERMDLQVCKNSE